MGDNSNDFANIPLNLQSPRDNDSVITNDFPCVVLGDEEKQNLIARKNTLTTEVNDWVTAYTAEHNGSYLTIYIYF